jgi:hypothetical protein
MCLVTGTPDFQQYCVIAGADDEAPFCALTVQASALSIPLRIRLELTAIGLPFSGPLNVGNFQTLQLLISSVTGII